MVKSRTNLSASIRVHLSSSAVNSIFCIYQGRFEELQREIMIGVEASQGGEVIDGETVFPQLQQKLQQK